MRRHQGEAHDDGVFGHGRRDDGRDEDAFVEGHLHGGQAFLEIAHEERDDGRLGMADVEAAGLEFGVGVAGQVPEMREALGFVEHDVDGPTHGGHVGRRHAGAEDQRPGIVFQILDHGVVAGDEAAQAAERLGEGAHDQVYLVGQAEMVGRAAAVVAHDAEAVGIVDHQRGVVLLAKLHQLRDRGDVAFHRIDAVHHDEFRRAWLRDLQFLLKFIHIVVGELEYAAEGKPAAVDDAGVVERIEEDVTVAEAQAGDDAQVYLETGAIGHGFFFADQFGEFLFEGQVDVECSIKEPRAGAAGPVFADGLDGGLFETGIVGQSQIGIRAEHQHILSIHFHHRVLAGFNGAVIRVYAHGLYFVGQRIFGANLVEKTVVHIQVPFY